MRIQPRRRGQLGFTLAELMVSVSVLAILTSALTVGLITVRKSFLASEHHGLSQVRQLRIIDYISLDLRRALTVKARADGGVDLTIPDYYANADTRDRTARLPKVVNGDVRYGDASVPVSYYKRGAKIYRSYNGAETALASDVNDFVLTPELSAATVGIQITFVPRYRLNGDHTAARDGTAAYARTLLRNNRS